jgi:hypothetical protein
MNHPLASKINATALVMAGIGIADSYGFIPPGAEEHFAEITLIVGPLLVMVWRTWFTKK